MGSGGCLGYQRTRITHAPDGLILRRLAFDIGGLLASGADPPVGGAITANPHQGIAADGGEDGVSQSGSASSARRMVT
jgi:hypothetical protein